MTRSRLYFSFLLALGLCAVFSVTCTAQSAPAVEIVNGNKFTMQSKPSTITVADPVTGEQKTLYVSMYEPVSINDEKIYSAKEVTTVAKTIPPGAPLDEYLANSILKDLDLAQMEDGFIHISSADLVVDKDGKLAYYVPNVSFAGHDQIERSLTFSAEEMADIVAAGPLVKPATLHGLAVNSRMNISFDDVDIRVKDHTAKYTRGSQIHVAVSGK